MRGPLDDKQGKTSLRQQASKEAKAQNAGGKAIGRIKFFEAQRGGSRTQYKNGTIVHVVRQANYYATAMKAKRALTPTFAASVALPVWRQLGPKSIPNGQTYGKGPGSKPAVSGRCVGILIDPADSRMLTLCSAGGGLWRSTDNGGNWRALTDDQPTLSLGALAMAPSSPNILYAGTGEGDTWSPLGLGLLRSSDGGASWSHLPSSVLAGVAIFDIEVHPTNALHVFVGSTKGLFESLDGGKTWVRKLSSVTWDISVNPKSPAEVYAATENGLQSSSNGGVSWSAVLLPGVPNQTRFTRMEVCHAPSKPGVVYVAAAVDHSAFLWRRTSASTAFKNESIPTPLSAAVNLEQAWYDWCFAVSPDDPDMVFWGVVDLFRGKRSSAGSLQWENISSRTTGDSIHPDQHHIAFDPKDPKIVYVCNDGGVFRSPDRGQTWLALNKGLSITEFEFLAQLEGDATWIIGGTQDNGTLSHDGSETWKQIALGDGGDCGVDEGGGLCYHSYFGMWIERAATTGSARFKWKNVSPPFPSGYEALFYPPMDIQGTHIAKAGISVFVSADSGTSWAEIKLPTGSEKASALTFASSKKLFVGTTNGQLFQIERTTSWASAKVTQLTTPVNGYLSDIVLHSGSIWISSSKIGVAHVLQSTDDGASWLNRSTTLPDIPINAIVVDPKDAARIFAASDHGVYQTVDGGSSWSTFSNGLPNVVVSDLILHESRRLLRAGTKSRGAWEVSI